MGLSWQQGPLSSGAIGRFLVPEPLPKRLLYVEPLRRRMRVRFGGNWIADSEKRFPALRAGPLSDGLFPGERRVSKHSPEERAYELPSRSWAHILVYRRGWASRARPEEHGGHIDLPTYASELQGRLAFAWPSMDAFYEEDERIVGHAADCYHRIDIRQTSRHLVVRHRDRIIADTKRPVALYESGFAPRWYVPRADVDESALTPVERQTFCPYKGLCSYYNIGDAHLAVWSYPDAYPEVGRISNFLSFEPDVVSVQLDGKQLHLEPGQTVIPHGPDRELTIAEVLPRRKSA